MATGVYLIIHKESETVYVGSTAKSFKGRWRSHRRALLQGRHPNKYLQRAWNKYGEGAFNFCEAERCSPEECLITEQKWLAVLYSEGVRLYNRQLLVHEPKNITLDRRAEAELWRADLSFDKPKRKEQPKALQTVFELACEFARVRAAALELPDLYADVETELKALVAANCGLLRDYRQSAEFSMAGHCASTGLSAETLYRIEGGDLDGVPIEDIETLLDTCASGDCG